MKYGFFLLFLSVVLACGHHQVSHKDTVIKYFEARNDLEFQALQSFIGDSITIVAGDYVMPYDQESFYEVFKWDSIFKPSYRLLDVKESEDQIIASVKINSIKHAFLKNNGMICDYLISFDSGKISEIKELDCKNANWTVWNKEITALSNWVEENHPELNGFVNDMTMKGALNYIKAITLYKQRKYTE